jgi:hypothetical protein
MATIITKVRTGYTSKNNNNFPGVDTFLYLPTLAPGTWRLECFLKFQGDGGTGIQGLKTKFFANGGLGGDQYLTARGVVNNYPFAETVLSAITTELDQPTIDVGHYSDFLLFDGIFTTSTDGAFGLMWSQSASNVNYTSVNAGSWMELTQLA